MIGQQDGAVREIIGGVADGHFVHAISAGYEHRFGGSQLLQGARQQFAVLWLADAEQLKRSIGRIAERP